MSEKISNCESGGKRVNCAYYYQLKTYRVSPFTHTRTQGKSIKPKAR